MAGRPLLDGQRLERRILRPLAWTTGGAALILVVAGILISRDEGWRSAADPSMGSVQQSSAGSTPSRPEIIPPPLPGGDASVSPEPLPLILVRTELGRRPSESLAFVGTSPRNPQVYREGSLLSNGARVKSIAMDHVILERDGRTARLGVAASPHTVEAQRKGTAGAIDSVGGPPPKGPELIVSNERVTDIIRPRPVFDELGRFEAYELHPGDDQAAFRRLGLEPGDRMVAADGQTLLSPEQAAAALQIVAAGGSIKAAVQRGGEVRTLRLDGGRISRTGSPEDVTGQIASVN